MSKAYSSSRPASGRNVANPTRSERSNPTVSVVGEAAMAGEAAKVNLLQGLAKVEQTLKQPQNLFKDLCVAPRKGRTEHGPNGFVTVMPPTEEAMQAQQEVQQLQEELQERSRRLA